MSKWIAEFELEDGDTMPEHMDLEYAGVKIDFHCKPLEQAIIKPYLEKLKEQVMAEEREVDFMNEYSAGWNSCLNTITSMINNLLSEREVKA